MCQRHHLGRELFMGVFKDWSREQMREWLDEQIHRTQAEHARFTRDNPSTRNERSPR
jgi:hypothetical protein